MLFRSPADSRMRFAYDCRAIPLNPLVRYHAAMLVMSRTRKRRTASGWIGFPLKSLWIIVEPCSSSLEVRRVWLSVVTGDVGEVNLLGVRLETEALDGVSMFGVVFIMVNEWNRNCDGRFDQI